MSLPLYPFDPQRTVGTVTEVGPSIAKLNLPHAAEPSGQWLHGHRLGAGEIGEFLLIECADLAILGRLTNIKLPERERLSVEQELGSRELAHPLGTVQLLATISVKDGKVLPGIAVYPRLGSKAYSAHPRLVKWISESFQKSDSLQEPLVMQLGMLPSTNDTTVQFTPERLFGRHCALLGATGGGKSWTIARLLEQASLHEAKIILLDATGEFYTLSCSVRHVQIGAGLAMPGKSTEVAVPYNELTEGDLFALFKPSGQTQGPKLREAMKSLKLARLDATLAPQGIITKSNQPKAAFQKSCLQHAAKLEAPDANFEIRNLVKQISEECVYPSSFNGDFSRWGKSNEQELNYCVPLMTRIEDILGSNELACVFKVGGKTSVSQAIEDFLQDREDAVLRVSLKYLPFGHNAREIVANAVGRQLLKLARDGRFRDQPLIVFLDEAHQFLSKELGDENSRFKLDSFELIAKEGRKFALNICISTQRPRDIPEGVISQMGTLIVHRLTNDKDREVVERASGDIDKSAAAFLPTLSPGQAVVIGVDFPMPLTVQVEEPNMKPDSRGPDYQKHWRSAPKPSTQARAATGRRDAKPPGPVGAPRPRASR